jgi:hypothetical protein
MPDEEPITGIAGCCAPAASGHAAAAPLMSVMNSRAASCLTWGFSPTARPGDYACWLGNEPDPRELMRPLPADLMRMWPISTRVNQQARERRSCRNRHRIEIARLCGIVLHGPSPLTAGP